METQTITFLVFVQSFERFERSRKNGQTMSVSSRAKEKIDDAVTM